MAEINPGIFKAYDVRGIYPSEINEEAAYRIGRAFVLFLGKESPKIVVARDNRLSSPSLFQSLTRGICDQGGQAIDIGLSPTPMFYFAVVRFGYDGGLTITASHNPPQYNGLKMVRECAVPISGESGINDIKEIAGKEFPLPEKQGSRTEKSVLKEYVKFSLTGFELEDFGKMKIVIDTANAVSGIIIPEMMKDTSLEIHHIFQELDGSFPNHNPDPLVEDNLRFLKAEVIGKGADLGVAFDGDGDRIFFLDEKGKVVTADLVLAFLAGFIINKPGQKFLYDIRSSNALREKIEEKGGIALAGRIGHSFVKERMRKEDIVFAAEYTGHYYSKDQYFCEVPFFVMFSILQRLSIDKRPFSEMINSLKKYYHSGEINFKVADKAAKIQELKNRYSSGKILEIDGVRVDFKDWWFLVRASNTEPLLRLVLEAKSNELMEEKKKELTALIEG